MADLIGQRLGQYEIVSLLGHGGMAVVYRARQTSIDRYVAVKVIESKLVHNPEFVKRFEREAQTIASLSHSHILKVFDFGEQDDLIYLVMEYLTGGSLADLLEKGPLSLDTAVKMMDQISSALDYAHHEGIVHRDLKPQNVLLDRVGDAHLADFGIAKILYETSALTLSGVAMGTPSYMAPEQGRGQGLDARADVYSFGVMLFEMLTGRLPFNSETPLGMIYAHINEPPPRLLLLRPDLPPGVDAVIQKALAKDPDKRFASAGELAVAFKLALSGQTPVALPRPMPVGPATLVETPVLPLPRSTLTDQTTLGKTGNRAPLGLVGVVVAVIVIAGLAFIISRNGPPVITPTALALAAQPTLATLIVVPATVAASQTPEVTATATAVPPTQTTAPPSTIPTTAVPTTAVPSATSTDLPSATSTANLALRAAATFTAKAMLTVYAVESFTPTSTPNEQDTLDAIVAASETALAPTATLTLTNTPRPPTATTAATATSRPTNTPSATASFTATATPSQTASATLTPIPTDTDVPTMIVYPPCPGAPQSRLAVGMQAYLSATPYLPSRLRQQPGKIGQWIDSINPGSTFTIVDGPVCKDNLYWWEIRVTSGTTIQQVSAVGLIGWTAEGDKTNYFLIPTSDSGNDAPPDTNG